jgi:DNA invertase Pin-like site-specific DNA recombinase
MIEVSAYCRVSGKSQIDGHGFERQTSSIRSFCKKNNFKIVSIYKEQVSGIKDETDRPQFSAMVGGIMSNGHRTIIIESLDRLAREYRVQEQLIIYLASKGIDLIASNTGENITHAVSEDPMRKALIQIQGVFAELDKSLTVRKLRKAREKIRKEKGRCEGVKPYGFDANRPEEAVFLKRIRYMRRRSRYQSKGFSYQAIADQLNNEGVLPRHGSEWTANLVFNVLKK